MSCHRTEWILQISNLVINKLSDKTHGKRVKIGSNKVLISCFISLLGVNNDEDQIN